MEVREAYRTRFGIEARYRQSNQSRARTSSWDPLYRMFPVGVALFVRNVWQWLVQVSRPTGSQRSKTTPRIAGRATPRYQDVLDDFCECLAHSTQHPASSLNAT